MMSEKPRTASISSSVANSHVESPTETQRPSLEDKDLESSSATATKQTITPESTEKKVVADFTGPDDPENPMNWSLLLKTWTLFIVGLQAFVVTFGSSVYAPVVREVSRRFNVSTTAALLPLTLYVLGLAFGPTISAPISETHGRRLVYLVFFPVSLLFTLGAGCAQNFGTLLVCRFLAGAIGSGALAVGAGSASDMFAPLQRGTASSFFMLAPFAGPAFGPVVGGYVAQYKGWRWSQWVILMIGLVTSIASIFQKETYRKIILARKAKRLGLAPPPDPMASLTPAARMKVLLTVTIFRPVMMLFTEPIVAFLAVYVAFDFGVLFIFFAAFPLVFQSPYPDIQIYHFSTGQEGLVFLGIGVGILSAAAITITIDRTVYVPRTLRRRASGDMTPLPPENRVYTGMIGCILLPVGLFMFAWSARASVHWIVPVIATVLFGCGNLLVFNMSVIYAIDAYGPALGASALAANGILRYVFGAVFPLFTIQMYQAMGVAWATSLLGFITVVLLPIPWVLFKYGPAIRKQSRYLAK